jgi:hypothetical protein
MVLLNLKPCICKMMKIMDKRMKEVMVVTKENNKMTEETGEMLEVTEVTDTIMIGMTEEEDTMEVEEATIEVVIEIKTRM